MRELYWRFVRDLLFISWAFKSDLLRLSIYSWDPSTGGDLAPTLLIDVVMPGMFLITVWNFGFSYGDACFIQGPFGEFAEDLLLLPGLEPIPLYPKLGPGEVVKALLFYEKKYFIPLISKQRSFDYYKMLIKSAISWISLAWLRSVFVNTDYLVSVWYEPWLFALLDNWLSLLLFLLLWLPGFLPSILVITLCSFLSNSSI